jgi:phospho-N-acetylmuramoyl-pentapeptide-transferase
MFLELINFLAQFDTGFSVLSYLTIRAILAMLSALFIALMLGRVFINRLQQYQIGQVIRTDGPKSHLIKAGTPTMGGILILFSLMVSVLIWGDWSNIYLWIVIVTSIVFGAIGFMDDYLKIKHKSSNGLSSSIKFLTQSLGAVVIST